MFQLFNDVECVAQLNPGLQYFLLMLQFQLVYIIHFCLLLRTNYAPLLFDYASLRYRWIACSAGRCSVYSYALQLLRLD